MWVVRPEMFRHTEDEFLRFLRSRGIEGGRRAELEPALRKALARTENLDRYIPDLWAVIGEQLFYIDVKSETAKHAKSQNGTIELRPLLRALEYPGPHQISRTIFVHYPDWGWADAKRIISSKKWVCCQNHWGQLQRKETPPEKCREIISDLGSGDPYLGFPLSVYQPIELLLGAEEDEEREIILEGTPVNEA